MDKNWNIIEKVIGIIGILLGFGIISFFTYSWGVTINQLVEDGLTTWKAGSVFNIIKGASSILVLCSFSIISGILLLKSLKAGWITSILNWFFISLYFLHHSWKTYRVQVDTYEVDFSSDDMVNFSILIGIITIIFLAISILLVQKPFREKYNSKPIS